MVQFQPGGSLSAGLGAGIGQGLSSGLQLLAEQRMNQLQKNQQLLTTGKALVGLGFSPEQAAALAGAPPELQKEALKQNSISNYLSRYGGEGGTQQEGGQYQGGFEGIRGQDGAEPTGGGLSFLSPEGEFSSQGGGQGASPTRRTSPAQTKQQLADLQAFGGSVGQAAKAKLDLISQEEDRGFKQQQFGQKERQIALQQSEGARKVIRERADDAREALPNLDILRDAIDSGNLPPRGIAELASKVGLGSAANLWSEDADIVNSFGHNLLGIKSKHYKGNLNKFQVESLFSTLPNLKHSTRGNKLIVDMLFWKQFKPAIARQKAADEILRESQKNKTEVPLDFDAEVDRRVAKKIKKYDEKFDKAALEAIDLGKKLPDRTPYRQGKAKPKYVVPSGRIAVINREGVEGTIPKDEYDPESEEYKRL